MKFFHVVPLLCTCLVLVSCAGLRSQPRGIVSPEEMTFLEEMTRGVLEESRVAPGASVGDIGPNTTGKTLIRPGGRNAYPAFWIRDYAMSLDAGMVSEEEQRHALWLTAQQQVDEAVTLPSGSLLPAGSIPDHISFGGVPIFFPGVLEDFAAQGGPMWGRLPSLDDHFYFIHMAAVYAQTVENTAFLQELINGKTLLQRLEEAFAMPPCREDNGLVSVNDENRGVNFGFFDTVVHTGDLFFCSLLKFQAAVEMERLVRAAGDADRASFYREQSRQIGLALAPAFQREDGFFSASTGLSGQADVWGTAFAVYIHALPAVPEQRAVAALLDALRSGTIAWEGGIRHVPTDGDFSAGSAWEKCLAERNQYQNGAYWDTPVGWVCYAVALAEPAAAQALAEMYLAQLHVGDYRLGPEQGAPWECRHPKGDHRQNPVYLASVSCPLAAFRKMNAMAPVRLVPGMSMSVAIDETF